MPFDTGFRIYPWVEKLLAIRHRPLLAHVLAIILVLIAVAMREAVAEAVGPQVPFITFYPAIILAALIGGLWPGVVATLLSTLVAWYAFIAPVGSFSMGRQEALQLALFLFINGINVAISVLLNALVERLVIQHRNIRLLLDSASNGFLLVDDEGRIKMANAAAEMLFGYKHDELSGKEVEVLVPQERLEAHRRQRRQYQEKPEARLMGAGRDLSGRRRDGTEFPVEIGLSPIGRQGRPAVLATVIDITARKRAEDMQRLVVRELQHRMRNALAVVQAIAARTLEDVDSKDVRTTLLGRIKALAQAYELAQTDGENVSLARIIEQQVAAHGDRVVVQGCDVPVSPRIAQLLSLVVHELTTNAVKHGALSGATGIVVVTGQVKTDGIPLFLFTWQEQGGPVVALPTRRGFGSTVLQEAARDIARGVRTDYRPEGLLYQFEAELPAFNGQAGDAPRAAG